MRIDRNKYELAKARACMSTNDIVAAGIPRGTLCRVINKKSARPETIGKIAKILGVDVTEIIQTEGQEDEKENN